MSGEKCSIHVEHLDSVDTIYRCNRPAKYKTVDEITGKELFVCGLHRNSIDIGYKKRGLTKRCEIYINE